MQFTHSDIECFVAKHKMNRNLSKLIIDRVGGEAEFLKKYRGYAHNDLTADVSKETTAFYEKNKSEIHQRIKQSIENVGLDSTVKIIAMGKHFNLAKFSPLIKNFIDGKSVSCYDHIASAVVTYVNTDFAVGMEVFTDNLHDELESTKSPM